MRRTLAVAAALALPACSLLFSPSKEDLAGGANDPGPDGALDTTGSADGQAPGDGAATDAGTDARVPSFVDDFARADGPSVGNGWYEKFDTSFSLSQGKAVWNGPSLDFKDGFVRRPESENVLDVEVAATFEIPAGGNVGFPGLLARIDPLASAPMGALTAYSVYLPQLRTELRIGRDIGNAFVDVATGVLSQTIADQRPYRFVLRVTGTNPVKVHGEVIDLMTSSRVGNLDYDDQAPSRIMEPGSVGFTSESGAVRFDDFSRTNL